MLETEVKREVPLLNVETEVNGDSQSTNERGPPNELHIYIEEVERKGLGRGTGLQLPARVSLINFSFVSKIVACYILAQAEQFSYHDLRY